jgi:4-amino-4-deoxy-L-arabinose transferase-like glycosyltransferase
MMLPPRLTGRAAPFALVFLCLLLLLPGFFALPPLDRDESRFAQATKQMVETGEYIDIRFQDEPRHKKPIGIYWLQAASVQASGLGAAAPIWVYRLPSLLAAIGAALLTWAMAARWFGREAGFLAGALFASVLVLGVEARHAKTDAALLFFILLAQSALARLYEDFRANRESRTAHALLFWVATGIAVLVKGPITLLVSIGTLIALALADQRIAWWRRLKPLPGMAIVAAIVLPWGIAIVLKSDGGFLAEAVHGDLLGKVGQAQESHGGPPGYYLLTALVTFWPATLALIPALPYVWKHRGSTPVRFCLAWIVPSWITFELVATKLPHYTLPVFPALAILAAAGFTQGFRIAGATPLWRWLTLVLWLAPVLALAVALAGITPAADGRISWAGLACAAAVLALGLATAMLIVRGRGGAALAAAFVTALLAYQSAYAIVLPNLHAVWLSPRILHAAEAAGCAAPRLVGAGYNEPSLVFLAGTATAIEGAEKAAQALVADDVCSFALVTAEHRAALAEGLARRGLWLETAAEISGFNYSKGDAVRLTLMRARTRP